MLITLLLSLFLSALVVYFIVSIQGRISENSLIGFAPGERRVSVQGEGKVLVKPDVAEAHIGVLTQGSSVGQVQQENSRVSNAIISFLKQSGVDDKDIKTINYFIQPRYDYSKFGRGELIDYEVRNTVQVKIRNLEKVGEILEGAGKRGANDVSSLQFVVDEPEKYQEEARTKAFNDAKKKADKITSQLNVKLGKVVNFSEGFLYSPRFSSLEGKGGDLASAPTPQIEPGENEIRISVSVTYEIK